MFNVKELTTYIEDYRLLFFMGKICISTENEHIIGPAWGKIGVSGDKTESLCHPKIKVFLAS